MKIPDGGVTVRMFRQGHGDCFLLGFSSKNGNRPTYVLIDCGYIPGSQRVLDSERSIEEFPKEIGRITGNRLDVVVMTHEHQDHLNGFGSRHASHFETFRIDEAWLAWTEDPKDSLANRLREDHRDQLLQLLERRKALARAFGAESPEVQELESFLSLELGDDFAAVDPASSNNKQAMKKIKDKATNLEFLSPGREPLLVPGTEVKVYVLGPPRTERLLLDEDPRAEEGFPEKNHRFHFSTTDPHDQAFLPFTLETGTPLKEARTTNPFLKKVYGNEPTSPPKDRTEVNGTADWRRIDDEWLLGSSEQLALALNEGINNTSLVLAFELPKTGKVLFFPADAQRGSWVSWPRYKWEEETRTVTARELLARTVLYKVSHHGSHNATLAGGPDSDNPSLGWMAKKRPYDQEFTAMIPAVEMWAFNKRRPWRHPLPAIKEALVRKTEGRILQTDIDLPEQPAFVHARDWERFIERCSFKDKHFDLTIKDEWE